MTIEIPAGLDWLKASARGRAWLESLTAAAQSCIERWGLTIGKPFPTAYTSLTVPASLADGTDVVLRIPFPDRESEHEALALAHWDGDGAIELIASDPALGAFLVERCVPGTPLSNIGQDAALEILISLLPRLWKRASAPPFRSLAEEAAWWESHLDESWERAGRPFEAKLVDAALEALRTLPGSQGEQVLLHQDLHGDNVLRSRREPWLAIDPKPLIGEREFALAPIVRSSELGAGRRALKRRLDQLTSELGLDRDRARLWCVAQTVAWYSPSHVEIAKWLLDM